MPTAPKFFVGDKVRHKQLKESMTGEVVKVGKEVNYPGVGPARKIYYKGWDPFDPEKVEWTWDFCMEIW